MPDLLTVFNPEWFLALGSILFINLILSGDNAVIIAMASKNLPKEQRNKAILWGSAGAVFLRIILTFLAASLLDIPYLQGIGGLALLLIAINLLGTPENEVHCEQATSLKNAIKVILFADLIMSLDNVLALAAIAQTVPDNKYSLIIIGLATSIPLVVFGAQILMKLMDRLPIISYFGAGILGYAAAEMLIADQALNFYTEPYKFYIIAICIIMVLTLGYLKKKKKQQ